MVREVVALDVGGTSVRCALVVNHRIRSLSRAPTPNDKKSFLLLLENMIRDKLTKGTVGVGVGFPSIILDGVKTTRAPNLPLQNFPLASYLKRKFKVPVRLENDASCVALAEQRFGVRKKRFVVMTLGTGIGGGMVVDGKLLSGRGSEFGHLVVCDHVLEDHWKVMKRKVGMPLMSDLLRKNPSKAKLLFDEVGYFVGQGVASLINAFGPEVVVLAGGPRECGSHLLKPIQKYAKKYLFLKSDAPPIVWSKLSEPGILGASLLV